ncbi:MAG: HDOD domain-containing protein [Planctomycetes bacterium]|nr:HDOD domain-containing protein [Planctomycetota bacterium]
MREVPTADVQEGMVLARDVINDRGQRVIKKETAITATVLAKLRSLQGVRSIWIEEPKGTEAIDFEGEWEKRFKAAFQGRFAAAPQSPYMSRFESLLAASHKRHFLKTQGIEREPAPPADAEGVRTFRERILSRIEEAQSLPSLPIIIEKLDKVLNDPQADAGDIAQVLILDPALAARILRMINSAFFGLSRKVERIDQAVVFLGVNQIRTLALTASVFSLFSREKGELFDPLKFWEHSLSVAIGCRLIAKTLNEKAAETGGKAIDVEDAFLAGLLLDVGKILMALYFPPAYEKIRRLAQAKKVPLYDAELAVLGVRHTDIGHRLFEKWGIKPDITSAARYHHEPGTAGTFAYVVHLADLISRGLGFLPDTEEIPRLDPQVWAELDIADPVVERIGYQMLSDFEETRALLAD